MEKLKIFHADQTPMCLDPYLNSWLGWRRETGLSRLKIIILTVQRPYFFCRSFVLFMSCECHA